jgi:hypothetical protein
MEVAKRLVIIALAHVSKRLKIVMPRTHVSLRAQQNPQLVMNINPKSGKVVVPKLAVNHLQNHTKMHYAVIKQRNRQKSPLKIHVP